MRPLNPSDRSALDSPAAVVVRGATKVFKGANGIVEALRPIDLDIRHGEFLCIVGPSGCGKSTLLNILAGLETPTAGEVAFDLPDRDKPKTSVVFQEQGVFPWMTTLENAAFGLRARGVPKEERIATARRILQEVGLGDFEKAYPSELSGGMRQRVNLARAFANDPQLLLMDEPFASVDEQTKIILQEDLLLMWDARRKTVLFITHSIDEAIRLGDRIIVMSARPGSIKADIPVRLPRPRNIFDLQSQPAYVACREQVWQVLKEEVRALR